MQRLSVALGILCDRRERRVLGLPTPTGHLFPGGDDGSELAAAEKALMR